MFAIKSALRRDMLRKLRGVSQDQLEGQCKWIGDNQARTDHLGRAECQKPRLYSACFNNSHSTRTPGQSDATCPCKRANCVQRISSRTCCLAVRPFPPRTPTPRPAIPDSAGKKLYTPYLPPAATASSDKAIKSDQAKTPKTLDEDHEPGSENPLMEMLRLYTNEDLEQCPLDKWGILDPGLRRFDVDEQRENGESDHAPRVRLRNTMTQLRVVFDAGADDLDLILLPGVAFDDECNRVSDGRV